MSTPIVWLSRSAKQELFRLPGPARKAAAAVLDGLGAQPFVLRVPFHRMRGVPWTWYVEIGAYRMVVALDGEEIVVTRIATQRQLYRI